MTPGAQMGKMEESDNLYPGKEAIHSGHFMVSEIDDIETPEDDNVSVPVLEAEDSTEVVVTQEAFDFEKACQETSNTYCFGPRYSKSISIDATLTKLFQCMSIAYSGNKLTSPRWKNFKGLKLRWKDKIRLNNVIWRAWHMQFIKWQKPVVCQFASPLDGDTHNKPEAVVLEGKYWKRRLDTVCAEYNKWRLFYKEKFGRAERALSDSDLDFDILGWTGRPGQGFHSSSSMSIDDDPFIDFNDTLFSCLIPNQPFAFPNPRDIARVGIADFIQPGLIQLQPNLDDMFDTLDLFSSRLPPVWEEQSEDNNFQDMLCGGGQVSNETSANQLQPFDSPANSAHSNSESLTFGEKPFTTTESLTPYDETDYTLMETNVMTSVLGNQQAPPPPPPLPKNKMSPPLINSGLSQQLSLNMQPQPLNQSSTIKLKTASNINMEQTQTANVNQLLQTQSQVVTYSQQPNIFVQSQVNNQITPNSHKYVSILPAIQTTPTPLISTQPNLSTQLCSSTSSTLLLSASQVQIAKPQTQTKQDVFIMPKGVPRIRSRSLSGSHRSQSVSPPNSLSVSTSSVCQNALLAQLLTSGNYKSVEAMSPATSNLNIIANQQPTVVLSPIQLEQTSSMQNPILSISTIPNTQFTVTSTSSKSSSSSSHIAPTKPFRPKSDTERVQYREHRRVCHINAEQKRRCNIKTGFDMLNTLVPSLMQNPPNKLSKAVVLQKAGEYIVQLKTERTQLQEEADLMRKQIESLNQAINVCQAQLPATGAPVSRQRISKLREMFDEYVRKRTLQNWKFWIFSILIQPLLESYNNSVTTTSVAELSRTVLAWLDQHCSLIALRPAVLNSLRHLSTTTNILSDPTHIAEEATQAVSKSMPCGR